MQTQKFSNHFIKRAVVIWSSFLSACVGFVLVFAFVDPVKLGEILSVSITWNSLTGYAVGFAILFLVALISSALTLVLLKKRPS